MGETVSAIAMPLVAIRRVGENRIFRRQSDALPVRAGVLRPNARGERSQVAAFVPAILAATGGDNRSLDPTRSLWRRPQLIRGKGCVGGQLSFCTIRGGALSVTSCR